MNLVLRATGKEVSQHFQSTEGQDQHDVGRAVFMGFVKNKKIWVF